MGGPSGGAGGLLVWRQVERTGQSWTGFADRLLVARVVHYDVPAPGWVAYVGQQRVDDGVYPTAGEAMAVADEAWLELRIADLDAGPP